MSFDNILNDPYRNKGTAFNDSEREKYNLYGVLPPKIEVIEEQSDKVLKHLSTIEDDYEKHLYLMSIYSNNKKLFFHTIQTDIENLLPIIYTPTIADAVEKFSQNYSNSMEAVYLSITEPERIQEALVNGAKYKKDIKLLVITDGQGVLGIGDWGVNGAAIAIGKLAVYTVAAGLDPQQVLPVVIDAGTNNTQLLNDPDYIGLRQKRIEGKDYLSYIDLFVKETKKLYPKALFHWEDFGRGHAETIYDRYKNNTCTFNDDIQGTGIMMVAALQSVAVVTEQPLSEHKFLIFGAGTAGIGIADMIYNELISLGLSDESAKNRIFLFDRNGVVHSDLNDLTPGQKRFSHSKSYFKKVSDGLEDIIEFVRPSVLIGTSGQSKAFTRSIIEKMNTINERPAIFPISNPSSLAEASAEEVIKWTNGEGLVVTGSPTKPIKFNNSTYFIGQANNALLYPGLGLGLIAAEAEKVTTSILLEAAHAINEIQDLSKLGSSLLPSMSSLGEVSKIVSQAVVEKVIEEGLNQKAIDNTESRLEEIFWKPIY